MLLCDASCRPIVCYYAVMWKDGTIISWQGTLGKVEEELKQDGKSVADSQSSKQKGATTYFKAHIWNL